MTGIYVLSGSIFVGCVLLGGLISEGCEKLAKSIDFLANELYRRRGA